MSQKQGRTKKPRKPKTSSGKNLGAKHEKPPELLLVMMNKGLAHKRRTL